MRPRAAHPHPPKAAVDAHSYAEEGAAWGAAVRHLGLRNDAKRVLAGRTLS